MQKEVPLQDNSELTEREREILRLIATGTSNKNIALQLSISSNTVKAHLRNIFAKIGVATRTEAALYAIQVGLSQSPDGRVAESAAEDLPVVAPIPFVVKRKFPFLWIGVLVAVLLAGVVLAFVFVRLRNAQALVPTSAPPKPATAAAPLRWQKLAAMPTARSGLAVAVYDNKVYAIGGATTGGVTGVVEQFDETTGAWLTLASKPVPVTDINAAVVGGKIFIPGGRLASGALTAVLESYDPGRNLWETHAALPVALSGYALVAFEGKLYVFGGWDGQKYLASVYEYDPEQDTWLARWPMPTARAFAGAAIAGGSIYVIGGTAGGPALAVNEEYLPERDSGTANPWLSRSPIPQARFAMGLTSIADIIYAVGGLGNSAAALPSLQYLHQQDQWQTIENPPVQSWSNLGLAPLQTRLYALGGSQNGQPAAQNLSYQAIYTISLPIAP